MSNRKVYIVDYKKVDEGYYFKAIDFPSVEATCPSLADAKSIIGDKILLEVGDTLPIIEFKPLTPSAKKFVIVEPEEAIVHSNKIHNLFEGKVCTSCKFGIGKRTTESLNLYTKPTSGVYYVRNVLPYIWIYPKGLLENITTATGIDLVTQEVLYKGKVTDYLEVLNEPQFFNRLKKGAKIKSSSLATFKCSKCCRESYEEEVQSAEPLLTYSNSDIREQPVIVVKPSSMDFSGMLLREDIANIIPRKKKLDKFTTSLVDILPESELYEPSELPTKDSIEWENIEL